MNKSFSSMQPEAIEAYEKVVPSSEFRIKEFIDSPSPYFSSEYIYEAASNFHTISEDLDVMISLLISFMEEGILEAAQIVKRLLDLENLSEYSVMNCLDFLDHKGTAALEADRVRINFKAFSHPSMPAEIVIQLAESQEPGSFTYLAKSLMVKNRDKYFQYACNELIKGEVNTELLPESWVWKTVKWDWMIKEEGNIK